MKLSFPVAFLLFLNVVWAVQPKRRVEPKIDTKLYKRGNELPQEIYTKRDGDASVSKRQALIYPGPYYPYYPQQQYQCEMCCNGTKFNGLYPYSSSCCGNKIYDSNTALCCGSNVLTFKPTTNYYQWQCCGNNTLYNSSSQICCGNQAYPQQPFQQCCGDKPFNASTQICCGNEVLSTPTYATWSCCASQVYDTTAQQCNDGTLEAIQPGVVQYKCGATPINFKNQICCNDVAVPRANNYTLCCGKQGYQANEKLCCGGQTYTDDQTGTQGCCGDQLINLSTQTCCNNAIVPTPTGTDCSNYYCCGSGLYNSASQTSLCCNDRVNSIKETAPATSSKIAISPYIPTYYYNYQCCGSETYNTQTETCCGQTTVVDSGPNALCCGNSTYDASQNTCCNNKLYPVGGVPLDMCCCPDGGCNIYSTYPIYPPIYY